MMNEMPTFHAYPKGFLWGAATSAHQIEGGNHNDWSAWENSPARLSDIKARGLRVNDYISGRACDSWERFEEDFNALGELNCTAYRMSVEWSRIEPRQGEFDQAAIEQYKRMFASLKKRKIKLVLTLWHWTSPTWLTAQGGWTKRSVVDYFARFVEVCVKEFAKFTDFWVVLNEPLMVIGQGYLKGKFPPNHRADLINSWRILGNLFAAQKAAYRLIHNRQPGAMVGVAMTTGYFDALHPNNFLERLMVKVANYYRNFYFLAKIKGSYDYIGVNYYHHDRLTWRPPFKQNENAKISDFGWEIYPQGLYYVLKNYAKLGKPIYVTENGIADADDDQRPAFILDHLAYLHQAITDGVDVRGYFHWSLLDNFEWADGFTMKFGLYELDRQTLERRARPSVQLYAEICKNNGFWR